jgi:hypothetical protein
MIETVRWVVLMAIALLLLPLLPLMTYFVIKAGTIGFLQAKKLFQIREKRNGED